ncbi:MAG: ferredoxin--NADP reductase [Salinispira sp.]
MEHSAARGRVYHTVTEIRNVHASTYILRFERNNLRFDPGQYISVGPKGDINMREYSIYSSVDSEYLEILVKEVEGGYISRKLKLLRPGDEVYVEGPFGFFLMDERIRSEKILFIGTGTGISPFHCFVTSWSELDYTILHGVRHDDDAVDIADYDVKRLIRCVSREDAGNYHGRVTDYLRENPAKAAAVYLCGNCDMIYEAYDILSDQGISRDRMFAEVYF